VVAVSADPFDQPLSALRDRVEDLAVALAIWCNRTEPDAHARRCANDAVDAIDAAIGHLHKVRRELVADIREADDRAAERADELLARLREDRKGGEQ
jgi:hypothetical protein